MAKEKKQPVLKRSKLKTVLNAFGYALIVLLVIALGIALFLRLSGRTKFLGGYTVIWVMSGSMEPGIPERSFILVKQAEAAEVEEGDVITFYSEDPQIAGKLNTHRVIEVIGDHSEFVTKGDNNPTADKYSVKAEKVYAKYVKNLDALSAAGRFFSTKIGLAATIALILLICIGIYVPDFVKFRKELAEETEKKRQEEIEKLVLEEVARMEAASEDIGKDGNDNV